MKAFAGDILVLILWLPSDLMRLDDSDTMAIEKCKGSDLKI
jgi:hypothetical protein